MLGNRSRSLGVLAQNKRLCGRPILEARFIKAALQIHCKKRPRFSPVLFALLLAGCASFAPDAGMDAVNGIVAPVLRQDAVKVSSEDAVADTNARVQQLLKSPLNAGAAVRIALVSNKGLQAAYNELGMAEALMVEASLPPNPRFSVSGISTPVELDVEARIVANILALATLPARQETAADRFRQAQLRAAAETLRVATETRRSYYLAVAALQVVHSLSLAESAADTSAKLAKELGDTGAMNKLDLARENAFRADVVTELTAARQRATGARERLIRALGLLDNASALKLPQSLPQLPSKPRALAAIETEALQRRVDLQIARIETDALAKSYGLTKATRFINLLDIAGVSRTQRDPGGPHGTGGGAEVEFQVPIFDFGEVRLRQAEEAYMAAVNHLTAKAVQVRSQAREAYQAYRSSYEIAKLYHTDVLPLRQTISDETMLRYGAMQIDVFSLMAEARQRITANIAAIEAQKNFWLASTDLDAALIGGDVTGEESASRMAPKPADSLAAE
jgi:outer membrane protein TolC